MKTNFISAIDIGTNSFHLLVVKVSGENYEVVHREREVLRLTENNNSVNLVISDSKIEEAIALLKKYKLECDKYGAEIHAVATSALRDAINNQEVCKRIKDEVGINIKILTGNEEAALVFKAVLYKKEITKQKILVFDLGGGSTEFIVGQNGKIIYKDSLQLGAVRFTNKHFPNFELTPDRIKNCREDIKTLINQTRKNIIQVGFDACIGIGGTISSVNWLIEKNIYGIDHKFIPLLDYRIMKKDFIWIKDLVLGKNTFEERKLIPGLEMKRADIIAAGIIIVDEFFKAFSFDEIVAPGLSIKEGVVISAIQNFNLK